VREAERNRIARDLHDDILQDIVYALQETNILQAISESDGISEELTEISDSLRRSVEGIRETIFELRLEDTLDQSFLTSLRALVELNRRMSRKRYTLEMEIEEEFPEYLPYRTVREIIRVLQEALNNARRHANPRRVWVRLGVGEDGIWAEVEDDGDGFDPQTFTGGVGQHSMRHRAASLGGKLRVESEPGAGSTVRLEIPFSRLIHE
jgi:signal transduction histidine kinase